MKIIYRFTALVIICVLFLSCGRSSYNVGDTVMSDGTVLTPSQFQAYKGSAEPVAVIFSVTGGEHENSKRVLGVGLKASSPMIFTPENTESYKTNIVANYSMVGAQDYDITQGWYTNEGFIGLVDGRRAWKNVTPFDSNAKTGFENYPAYDYALNYGINNNFKKFEKGWYLPTAAEARMLAKSNVLDFTNFIWTASQSYDAQENELVVNLLNGAVETGFKDMEYSVYSIYCFAN